MTWIEVLLANLVVFIGAALQGSIGFGLGLFASPLLMLIDPEFIPGPLLSNGLVLTLLLSYRERASIVLKDIGWAVLGRIVGVALAAAVVASITTDGLALMLGVLVLLLVGVSMSGLRFEPTRISLSVAGCLSGFSGTVASVGAPPMAIVYQNAKGSKIRGTLSAFFVIGILISMCGLGLVGRYGPPQILTALRILPGLLIGFLVSRRLAAILDRGRTRHAVLSLCAVGGVALIVRELI